MRLFQIWWLLFFTLLFRVAVHGQIPQVPSSVEIAEVKLKITSGARQKIQKDINAIRASDKYFRIKLDLVNLYFPIIERVLKEEGVPDDLKYLSIQESALQSDAVSSSNAVGYWQFKDFTAREVGMRVDGKVDERKNIVSATRGAAKYVKRNNTFFDNWIYAVNAYMTGPGGAKRYVDKSNFGTGKMTVTENTHWYVLRFIAHVLAYRDEVGGPHSQGLKLVEYTKGANKDLDQIARQFNVDRNLVKEYNKWLGHGKVPTDKVYTVIIPVTGKLPDIEEDSRPLVRDIKEPEPTRYPKTLTSRVGAGKAIPVRINGLEAVMAGEKDNVVSLAQKVGISSRRFERFNDLVPGEQIEAGEIYYTQRKRNRSPIRYHVAQHGETLWDIAQKYGVKLKKLARKNRMEEDESLKAGRVVWLRKNRPKNTPVEYHKIRIKQPVEPVPEEVVVQSTPPAREESVASTAPAEQVVATPVREEPSAGKAADPPKEESVVQEEEPEPMVYRYHEVKAGESLWTISRHHQVAVDEIREWNNLADASLMPGQKLRIPAERFSEITADKQPASPEVTVKASDEEETAFHIVKAGESLWTIAQTYNVAIAELTKWNNLPNSSLSIGQKLILKVPDTEFREESEEVNAGPAFHEVQSGESLWSIAQKHQVTIKELKDWNKLQDNNLQPGQKLVVKEGVVKSEGASYITYIVRGGDSLYKIARKHNTTVEEIMSLNNLTSSALSVGDELKVKRQ